MLLALNMIACGFIKSEPERVVERFFTNIADKQREKALELIDMESIPDWRQSTIEVWVIGLEAEMNVMPQKYALNIHNLTFNKTTYSDDKMKAVVSYSWNNGKEQYIHLIKKNKLWKIIF